MLVPVDFSECTPGQIDTAASYARRLGLGVTLLHVVDPPAGTGDVALEDCVGGACLDAESEVLLEGFVRSVEGVEVETISRRGAPAETILAVAEELRPELVVLGTHGRRGVRRLLLGSVAEQVIRRAVVPVITLRTQHRPSCQAADCGTCATHVTPVEERLRTELDG